MSVWNAQTSAIMLLGFLNISYAWHGNLAGQVAFPVAVLHLLVQGRPMLLFLLSWLKKKKKLDTRKRPAPARQR